MCFSRYIKIFYVIKRYIHKNTVSAGIEKNVKYKWSSYGEYARGNNKLIVVEE